MVDQLQKERHDRGSEFEAEIRRSWRMIPQIWRMKIPDRGGGTRPADTIVTTINGNILSELKRTKGDRFELNFLRPNQIRGLLHFEIIPQNYGLVFVSFQNSEIDEAYAFRLSTLMRYMKEYRFQYISREVFKNFVSTPAIFLPRTYYHDPKNKKNSGPAYDLTEVVKCCKLL